MATYNKENPPVVERNGVSLALSEQTFGKTSNRKGQKFWAPEITAANQEDGYKWVSPEILNNVITRFLRRIGIDIHCDENNYNTDGTLNMDSVLEDWKDFSSGVATLSDLEEQISELQDQISAIVFDDGMSVGDDGRPVNPEKYLELSERAKTLQQKIRPLKVQHKKISEVYSARAAKRTAKKEAASPTKSE